MLLMSRTSLGADYDISKSRTPLEAEYDISKIQTFHFKDWTLFEGPDEAQTPFKDPGRRNTVHLSKVRDWIPRRNFEGLGLPGMLQNFKGLWLLDENFENLQFSLGAIIFSSIPKLSERLLHLQFLPLTRVLYQFSASSARHDTTNPNASSLLAA
ncbi:hypothetical protein RCL_jg22795.t1 [Rhizophagus clarus]|uniref:Uncharacterized protein n=1 Tax=Rhizophagus clarus TaxID=94130 RepID=A0A8H3LDN2_9GLOM|nr:hypothetical protein RCL_jg22795.t1 [Rhizophagus clarus]